jgi:hypothetical protein
MIKFIIALSISCILANAGDRNKYTPQDGDYIDLTQSVTNITNDGSKFIYLRFLYNSSATGVYGFNITSSDEIHTVFEAAYDYWGCYKGQTILNLHPNKAISCAYFAANLYIPFIAYLESPLFIGVKFSGNAQVSILSSETIHLQGQSGTVRFKQSLDYQPYIMNTIEPGYIILNAASQDIKNYISIFYDAPGCRPSEHDPQDCSVHFPNATNYCESSSWSEQDRLVLRIEDEKNVHYIATLTDKLDRLEFKYDFDAITQVDPNHESNFLIPKVYAKPFMVQAKKGNLSIKLSPSRSSNGCELFVDYKGCYPLRFVKLPYVYANCLVSRDICSISIDLDSDTDVYFAIQAGSEQEMTVSITNGPSNKLAYLK